MEEALDVVQRQRKRRNVMCIAPEEDGNDGVVHAAAVCECADALRKNVKAITLAELEAKVNALICEQRGEHGQREVRVVKLEAWAEKQQGPEACAMCEEDLLCLHTRDLVCDGRLQDLEVVGAD